VIRAVSRYQFRAAFTATLIRALLRLRSPNFSSSSSTVSCFLLDYGEEEGPEEGLASYPKLLETALPMRVGFL